MATKTNSRVQLIDEKLNELMKEKEGVQAELDALYEKWEQLSEEAGE